MHMGLKQPATYLLMNIIKLVTAMGYTIFWEINATVLLML